MDSADKVVNFWPIRKDFNTDGNGDGIVTMLKVTLPRVKVKL